MFVWICRGASHGAREQPRRGGRRARLTPAPAGPAARTARAKYEQGRPAVPPGRTAASCACSCSGMPAWPMYVTSSRCCSRSDSAPALSAACCRPLRGSPDRPSSGGQRRAAGDVAQGRHIGNSNGTVHSCARGGMRQFGTQQRAQRPAVPFERRTPGSRTGCASCPRAHCPPRPRRGQAPRRCSRHRPALATARGAPAQAGRLAARRRGACRAGVTRALRTCAARSRSTAACATARPALRCAERRRDPGRGLRGAGRQGTHSADKQPGRALGNVLQAALNLRWRAPGGTARACKLCGASALRGDWAQGIPMWLREAGNARQPCLVAPPSGAGTLP